MFSRALMWDSSSCRSQEQKARWLRLRGPPAPKLGRARAEQVQRQPSPAQTPDSTWGRASCWGPS